MIPTRESIQAADDRRISDPIPVPEWGEGAVLHVRTLSGEEYSQWQEVLRERRLHPEKVPAGRVKASFLVRACCDPAGARVFGDEDDAWLAAKATPVLERLWDGATEINHVGEGARKELEKNSEPTPSDSSGSSSPAP